FGVVFFEMLSGLRLFVGETVSDTLAAVLRQEIDWNALPSSTPQAVRNLVQRCLERDPNLRLRDIGEARIALSKPPQQESVTSQQKRRVAPLYGILLPLVILAGVLIGRFLKKQPVAVIATSQPKSFSLLTDQPGVETEPSLSPDGKTLAYVKDNNGQYDIYVVRVGGKNAVNLTADSNVDDE